MALFGPEPTLWHVRCWRELISERGAPFTTAGFARMMERAAQALQGGHLGQRDQRWPLVRGLQDALRLHDRLPRYWASDRLDHDAKHLP
jgi:hypothetical protein